MAYKSLVDILKPQEEELIMSEMPSIQQNRLADTPPSQPELQAPMIPNETPQEQVFSIPAKAEQPMLAEAEAQQPSPEVPAAPMSKSEALLAEYQKMLGKDQQSLEDARSRDRMLKIGGSIGDALATYLNAKSQMNVKAPGVQVQQGAGLGKVADMFATAPEIQSDVAQRRQALMKQYGELAKGERSQARLSSEEKRANERMAQQERLAKAENEAMLKAAGIRASGKGELTPYQEMMQETKKNEAIDKKTQKLQADLNQSQAVATTISDVEKLLGFNLDDVDSKTGTVKGESVDLPGVNIPGKGRTTFYSSEARELDDTMSKLFNVELKNRSGVAVTPPELQNLKREFSEGKFNTEEEKLKALKRFKQGLKKAFANIEAGYPKEVISEYQDRGGFTSDRFGGTLESTQKSEKDKEVQDYADKHFKGDYDKASRFLKNREGI